MANQGRSCLLSCECTCLRNALYVWYFPSNSLSLVFFSPYMELSFNAWVTELESEYNLVSELFVFTGNLMNPSRKHLLKCKRQGNLIHTLNLAQREIFFFCSPKGMLTKSRGESDKFNKRRRISPMCVVWCGGGVCMCVCVCVQSRILRMMRVVLI